MITENWKDIVGYEGLYQVSDQGRIKSLRKGIILKPQLIKKTGYYVVYLCKDGKMETRTVHRLVASAFILNPNPSLYTDCDHIDEDKSNNKASNLQWITHKDNLNRGTYKKRMSISLKKHFAINGSSNGKPIQKLDVKGNVISTYKSMTEAAESLGKDLYAFLGSVRRVLNGTSKKGLAYGFSWRLVN